MATIKTPQTISHAKSNNGHNGHGFIVLLLIITWVIMGAGFYGIKSGMIQSEEVNPAVNEKISGLEKSNADLDTRLKVLEKRLSDASSALSPVSQNPAEGAASPQEIMPTPPAKPEDGAAAVVPPANIQLPDIKEEEKPKQPEDKLVTPPTKPQTDNRDSAGTNQTALLEKKSYL